MENIDENSATRLANPRTLQACQRCRSLKTRCLPSSKDGVCQRCSAAHKDCVWAETPRRARKARAPSRISQVEQKIDGLVASLSNPSTIEDPEYQSRSPPQATRPTASLPNNHRAYGQNLRKQGSVAPGSWLPLPTFSEHVPTTSTQIDSRDHADGDADDRQFIERIRTIHSFDDNEELAQAPEGLFQPSKQREAPIEDEMVQQLLSTFEANTLLDEYREMSVSFPFVIIHPDMNAQQLHQDKPMLLLAILTMASWRDHQRQRKLDALFRKELAHRTIISPRRTLGLVQSVLVYLSWYHFVFSHKTQQIFFLHHLVIGLALDVGLHKDYQPLNFPHRPKPPPPSPKDRRERHRAFLGCYYLASMIAAGLQKPNLLRHMPHMNEWARELQQDREYESDETIGHLITLRQIDDQIQDTLYSGDAANQLFTEARMLMHVRLIESQLSSWQSNRRSAGSQRLLDLSSSFTNLLLHNIALRPRVTGTQSAFDDQTQLSGLLSTLEAGKCFLDALLSFPVHEYHLVSFSEWMRLPTVIMTVARLCMPSDAHVAVGWDYKAAQDRVRLDLCLESLCYRMQQLATYDKVKQPHPDFWYAMRVINDLTKSWYARKIRPTSSQPTPAGNSKFAAPDFSGGTSEAVPTPGNESQCMSNFTSMGPGDLDMNMDDGDPFAFIKDLDIDMEPFLDMGIWGDESYATLGFGGDMSF